MSEPARDSTTPPEHSEIELPPEVMERAKAGDQQAFREIYSNYSKRCWTFLVHLTYFTVSEEDVKDIHQDIWVKVWRNLSKTRDDLNFTSWLYRITANTAIDYLRRKAVIQFLPLPEDEPEDEAKEYGVVKYQNIREYILANSSTTDPEEYICNTECLEQALSQVSPQSRICLLLQARGFTQREIAALLGIAIGGVGAYISRGRKQFLRAYRNL